MTTGRLEAFSDGVMAIIITIMVLELKVPHGADFAALKPLVPVLLSYVLSFIYLGIYWNNHHHMMHVVHRVSGGVLWANLLLLFWLSLVPFVTGWMGENHFAPAPCPLRRGPAGRRFRLDSCSQTAIVRAHGRTQARSRARQRPEGQGFACDVHGRRGDGLRAQWVSRRALRGRRADVVGARPED